MLHTPPPPLNGGRGGGVVLDLPRRRPRTTGRTRNCTARATGDPDRARLHRVVVVAANAGLLVERIQRLALRAVQAFQQPAPDWHYRHDCELVSCPRRKSPAATWTAALHNCDLDSSVRCLACGHACMHARRTSPRLGRAISLLHQRTKGDHNLSRHALRSRLTSMP
jgi:hypothetical protein